MNALLCALVVVAALALPCTNGAYTVTGHGYVKCGGTPVSNVLVKLMDDDWWIWDQTMGSARTDSNGKFSVTGRGGDWWGGKPDPFIKVEYDYIGKMTVRNMIGRVRYEKTGTRWNTVGTINFGTIVFNSDHCKAYNTFRLALLDYHSRSKNSRLPYSSLKVKTESKVTAGVPYATTDNIRIPKGYSLTLATAKHELAHTIRHSLDGSLRHFLYDAGRFWYLRHHDCNKKTNFGFAFNEGWAAYWAGGCTSNSGTDYTIEGNVATALRNLSNLACHSGNGPSRMVDVLERNRGSIHSFGEFKAKHDAMYTNC